MWEYRCTLLRVVDGDTVWLNVDLGFRCHVEIDVRLAGLDAPKASTDAGRAARDAVVQWLTGSSELTVTTTKNTTERYGRWLAVIRRAGDPQTLNDHLVAAGHAVAWDGRGVRPSEGGRP